MKKLTLTDRRCSDVFDCDRGIQCGSRPPPATDVEQKLEEVKGAEDGLRGKHDTARVVVVGGLEFGCGRQHRCVSVRGTRDKRCMLAVVGGAVPFFCYLSHPTCNSCISMLLVVFFSVSLVLSASSGVIVVTVFVEDHKAQSISLRFIHLVFSAGVSIALALACPPPPVPHLCFSFSRFRK